MKYSQIIIIVNNLCFLIVNYLGNSNTSIIIIISNGFLDWAQGLGPINDVAQSSMWHPVVHSTESGLHFSHFQCYPLMPHTTNHPFHVATCPIQIGPFHRPTLLPVHRSTAPQCRGHKIRMTCSEYQKQLTNLNAAMNGHEHATCPEGWFGIQWARETWRHQRAFATNFRQPLACGSHSENIILGDGLAEGQKIRTNSWEHYTLLSMHLSNNVRRIRQALIFITFKPFD